MTLNEVPIEQLVEIVEIDRLYQNNEKSYTLKTVPLCTIMSILGVFTVDEIKTEIIRRRN